MRYLRQVIPDLETAAGRGRGLGDLNRSRIARIESRQIFAHVRDDDAARLRRRVQKCDSDHIFTEGAGWDGLEPLVRRSKVQRPGGGGKKAGDGTWSLGDTQQQDRLVANLGSGGVEYRNHLEAG